ncbi:MAG: carbon-phosphorus lyase complex subunit PhnI [Spirochaetales bacterium]|jgi:alpha-D-ribose 1-methylphosphonate 5-triphosphate synthase subunit PhnI|nr:carbon-phosphorus lyase complex subunit PhnI [Spirochaetales bacterium]
MAYVAVSGGQEAVENARALMEKYRQRGSREVDTGALENRMGLLIDRIMGEAGFYAPRYAALALKQAEGSPEEAVFLLRAYRSTLSRAHQSLPLDGAGMNIHRRISAAFKDIPGGQFLGATCDYTHRLLNFESADGEEPAGKEAAGEEAAPEGECPGPSGQTPRDTTADKSSQPVRANRLSQTLKEEGLLKQEEDTQAPQDITRQPLVFPAPRPARLQSLARADTGFISGLAYAGIRGFGPAHPTVGELRTGTLEVRIAHPLLEGECLVVGNICVTEVESFFSEEETAPGREEKEDPLKILESGQGDKADHSARPLSLAEGYGMVFGRNDTKAIAMSILDYSLDHEGDSPVQNQEFVLLHGDCLEMNGFISHLKLPHYVTFQSKLDRVRHTRGEER